MLAIELGKVFFGGDMQMEYRKLSRTGPETGIIGLGTEYLWHEPKDTVISVVSEAVGNGVNYIDLFMPSPAIRDNIGAALHGKRDRVLIAGHLGAAEKDDQYFKTRDKKISTDFFHDLLKRLKTDYIDVLMLHFVDGEEDYNSVFNDGGLLELALRFKREGKARYIGMSSHKAPVSMAAVKSGYLDALMFPVNPAFDMIPGDMGLTEFWEAKPYNELDNNGRRPAYDRRELYHECEKNGVGIIAMKPYAAGWLFNNENASSLVLTPSQCISYALSQPGVCTVVPGCKTTAHMRDALAYLTASDAEKDYSRVISESKWDLSGSCMYCNHCLPCPAGIDIAAVSRLADSAAKGVSENVKAKYEALSSKASGCLECGACVERCPFGVDVISNMKRASDLFESC